MQIKRLLFNCEHEHIVSQLGLDLACKHNLRFEEYHILFFRLLNTNTEYIPYSSCWFTKYIGLK